MLSRSFFHKLVPWLAGGALLCSACFGPAPVPHSSPIDGSTASPLPALTVAHTPIPSTPAPTLTPSPSPTPTPLPVVARVNGEAITLTEFEAELARYQAALSAEGQTETLEAMSERVLGALIDEVLLAQAAQENGYSEDQAGTQARLEQLIADAGGEETFQRWLADNGYTLSSFQHALGRAAAAAWMRDQILTKVLETAEQVHARHILLYNSEQASQVLVELKSGKDFATLASVYDPVAAGDLGWFPRGYLTDLQLEEVAFSLQPGEYSQVISTPLGYHILQVIERAEARPLEADARLVLQTQALQEWLANRRSTSDIFSDLPAQ
jgi:peptidyl-prolyl cis-trans isomerase C